MAGRETHIPPVGFAREPRSERRRWIGRILLVIFVVFILWLAYTRVLHPPAENPVTVQPSELPAD